MENKPLRWCEISDECDRPRLETLSRTLRESGTENHLEFIEVNEAEFPEALARAESEFDTIRLGGHASEWIFSQTERMPSLTASLQCADAIAKEVTSSGARWWSRSFLFDGINRTLSKSELNLDLNGAVFILGARPVTRVLVSALARIGYAKFNIVDPDQTKAEEFCESPKKRLFGLDIQSVPRHLMTQLPGVHAVAANVLASGRDDGAIQELYYFNFLKPGGIWLDLPLTPPNSALEAEANVVGAKVIPAAKVYAWTDSIWANEIFGVELDVKSLQDALEQVRRSKDAS